MRQGFRDWLSYEIAENKPALVGIRECESDQLRNNDAVYVFQKYFFVQRLLEKFDGRMGAQQAELKRLKDELKNKQLNQDDRRVVFDEYNRVFVQVSRKFRDRLKELYLEETKPVLSEDQLKEKLALVRLAKEKLLAFNKLSPDELKKKDEVYQQEFLKAYDNIGMMAKLLRNKEEEGWSALKANVAAEIALLSYTALNFEHLAEGDIAKLRNAHAMISSGEKDGVKIGGLRQSVELNNILLMTGWLDDRVIDEYVIDVLDGGWRHSVDKSKDSSKKSFRANKGDKDAYYQQRFFPDADGKSETDSIAFHAGGMIDHSAIRILEKKADAKAEGGYKYYYIKADGGAGAEVGKNDKIYGVYRTEITPKYIYEKGFFGGGGYRKLTAAEIQGLDAKSYQDRMYDTISYLMQCELRKERLLAPKHVVNNGEDASASTSEAAQWDALNDIINDARGEKPFFLETPEQKSSNCSVYSNMLAIGGAIWDAAPVDRGLDITYDMMQEVKGYNHHNLLWQLNKLEQNLVNQIQSASIQEFISEERVLNAIKEGRKVNNEDLMGYLVKHSIKVSDMHPLIWALEHNMNSEDKVLIKGKDPLQWALKHNSKLKIEGMSFVRFLQVYGVVKVSALVNSLDEKGRKALLEALILEYGALLNKPTVNNAEVRHLEEFYNALYAKINFKGGSVEERGARIAARTETSQKDLSKLFDQYSHTEIALMIKSQDIPDNKFQKHSDNIEKFSLKEAYGLYKVGQILQDNKSMSVLDYIKIAIMKIRDFVKGQSYDQAEKSAHTDFSTRIREQKAQQNNDAGINSPR